MENITLRAHYDGTQIKLDEPFELEPNTRLLVTILSSSDSDDEVWHNFSAQGLNSAYSDDEPEYSISLIKEQNPDYERR
ncbi:MAG: hypothetical protein AB1757_25670 [Acidobacteriota bacterium]